MKRTQKQRSRTAVAAVEAAVCLPIVVVIFLGSVEFSSGIFQEYNVQAATYEISKVALRAKSTSEDVQVSANEILPALGIEQFDITIAVEPRTANVDSVESPTVSNFVIPSSGTPTGGLEELPRGTLLRLTVVAQRPQGGLNMFTSYLTSTIRTDCVFVKEF